jgi:hypothetical protein
MQTPVPLFTMFAIIIVILGNRKRRKIFNAFRTSSATSPECAKSLSELGIHTSMLFASQVWQKVIVSTQEGLYYLDEARFEKVMRVRRRMVFVLGVCMCIFAFILFLNS